MLELALTFSRSLDRLTSSEQALAIATHALLDAQLTG